MNSDKLREELTTYRPVRAPIIPEKKQGSVRRFVKSVALVGGLAATSMYYGAKNSEQVKGYVSCGVQKVEGVFTGIQEFFSGAMRRGLDVEDSIDAKVQDPQAADKREIMEFVKNANEQGMDLDKLRPYLKPEAVKKLDLLKSMYNDKTAYGGK